MTGADAAREVVGSLVDYKSGERCPVCDGSVTTMFALHTFTCEACGWEARMNVEQFSGQGYSYFTYDELADVSIATDEMSRLAEAAGITMDNFALSALKAQEVVGSLIDYKDGDGCPMCEGPVLTTTADNFYSCTICEWTAPYTLGMSPALRTMYDEKLLARLLPKLAFAAFGKVEYLEPKFGDTVTFRRFNALVTDAN